MAETIQGVGGTVPLATGYLPEVYKVGAGPVRPGWHGAAQHAVMPHVTCHAGYSGGWWHCGGR